MDIPGVMHDEKVVTFETFLRCPEGVSSHVSELRHETAVDQWTLPVVASNVLLLCDGSAKAVLLCVASHPAFIIAFNTAAFSRK